MAARAYRIELDGKKDVIFVEVNELGAIKYSEEGTAKAWVLVGEGNAEVNYLTGQHLVPVESVKELKHLVKGKK